MDPREAARQAIEYYYGIALPSGIHREEFLEDAILRAFALAGYAKAENIRKILGHVHEGPCQTLDAPDDVLSDADFWFDAYCRLKYGGEKFCRAKEQDNG